MDHSLKMSAIRHINESMFCGARRRGCAGLSLALDIVCMLSCWTLTSWSLSKELER